MHIATLGPTGTNSELAALWYMERHKIRGEVILTDTPEASVDCVKEGRAELAIACAVYPRLNYMVFDNLRDVAIADCFRFNTDEMVLARRPGDAPLRRVVSHPAPKALIEGRGLDIVETTSNSAAAKACADGGFDGCITTRISAEANGLTIVENFGAIPMGWVVLRKK